MARRALRRDSLFRPRQLDSLAEGDFRENPPQDLGPVGGVSRPTAAGRRPLRLLQGSLQGLGIEQGRRPAEEAPRPPVVVAVDHDLEQADPFALPPDELLDPLVLY